MRFPTSFALLCALSSLALSACGKKFNPHDNDKPGAGAPVAVQAQSAQQVSEATIARASDLKFEVTKTSQTLDSATSPVERLILLHSVRYASAHKMSANLIESKVEAALSRLTPELTADVLNDFKTALEVRMPEITPKKRALKFNKAASTIAHIVRQARGSSEAMTDLYLIALSLAAGSEEAFSARRPVVIYRTGHVLPGFMIQTSKGWRLYGVEMTALGKARIDFGLVSELKDEALRILDAAYSIALKAWSLELATPRDAAEQALALTAERYGIPRETLEKLVAKELPKTKPSKRQSPPSDRLGIAFGKTDARGGDHKRIEMDLRAEGAASVYVDPANPR